MFRLFSARLSIKLDAHPKNSIGMDERRSQIHRDSSAWAQSIRYHLPIAALILAFSSAGVCAKTLTETFETPMGTDNPFDVMLGSTNWMNPDFSTPNLPSSWGEESGLIFVGPEGGSPSAFWINRDPIGSINGYFFTGSFLIANAGLNEGQGISLFISKPTAWSGHLAAWRLYFHKYQGQLMLVLVVGLNTETNNQSAAVYRMPININQVYDVAIVYDTARRFYSWSVDGQVLADSNMPSDYPLIATKIIGSSGSSTGYNSLFVVDNVQWQELPGLSASAVPEPGTWLLLCSGIFLLACARGGSTKEQGHTH